MVPMNSAQKAVAEAAGGRPIIESRDLTSPAAKISEFKEAGKTCASCSSSLAGRYCSQCGEQVIDHHSLTVKHFLSHGILHELTHLDGKIFRTFRMLLFRPGFLSAEYFAGRRQKYVNPVRVLVTAALLFALAVRGEYVTMQLGPLHLSLLPPGTPAEATIQETIEKLDVGGLLYRLARRRSRTVDLASEAAAEKFRHELKTYGTAFSFCNVGLLALFLFALYRRRRPLFLEHLVFSFHLASFVLLFSIVSGWLFRLILAITSTRIAFIAVLPTLMIVMMVQGMYLYRALIHFYLPETPKRLRWRSRIGWATRGAVMLIFLANSVFITLTYATGAAVALSRI